MAACAPPARGKGVGVGEVHFLERSAGLLLGFFLLFPFFFSPPFFSLFFCPAATPLPAGCMGRVEGTALSPLPVPLSPCVTLAACLRLGIALLPCRPRGRSPEGL